MTTAIDVLITKIKQIENNMEWIKERPLREAIEGIQDYERSLSDLLLEKRSIKEALEFLYEHQYTASRLLLQNRIEEIDNTYESTQKLLTDHFQAEFKKENDRLFELEQQKAKLQLAVDKLKREDV